MKVAILFVVYGRGGEALAVPALRLVAHAKVLKGLAKLQNGRHGWRVWICSWLAILFVFCRGGGINHVGRRRRSVCCWGPTALLLSQILLATVSTNYV